MSKSIYLLHKSNRPSKKFYVETPKGKKIYFGAAGYADYTMHKNPARKYNYITRHSVNEDWTNLDKAGTWSRFILWNLPTIQESIADMARRFNIKIIFAN